MLAFLSNCSCMLIRRRLTKMNRKSEPVVRSSGLSILAFLGGVWNPRRQYSLHLYLSGSFIWERMIGEVSLSMIFAPPTRVGAIRQARLGNILCALHSRKPQYSALSLLYILCTPSSPEDYPLERTGGRWILSNIDYAEGGGKIMNLNRARGQ